MFKPQPCRGREAAGAASDVMSAGALRSLLFVPGTRPELFAKALASGADSVCVDLEDAVVPDEKALARVAGVAFLAGGTPLRVLRINSLKTADGLRDILALIAARPVAGIVFLPKVDGPDEIRWVEALLDEAALPLSIGVLIETAEGLVRAEEIATASARIAFLMFGGVDLAAVLGVAVAHEPLLYARSRLVHAGRLAGVAILDMPTLAFRDPDIISRDAALARSLGFTGKAVIHPSNVTGVHAAFAPSSEEVAWAEKGLAAYEAAPTGVIVVDGKMVDKPVLAAMRHIVARAQRDRSTGRE